jgi:hypothetical protein
LHSDWVKIALIRLPFTAHWKVSAGLGYYTRLLCIKGPGISSLPTDAARFDVILTLPAKAVE